MPVVHSAGEDPPIPTIRPILGILTTGNPWGILHCQTSLLRCGIGSALPAGIAPWDRSRNSSKCTSSSIQLLYMVMPQ